MIPKVILFCFAGRRPYLEIQLRYITALLNRHDYIEHYDIWNFSWSFWDSLYIKSLKYLHPKIRIRNAPNYGRATRAGHVASKQFAYFFHDAYEPEKYREHIFVKVDDDIVYVDIDAFDSFVRARVDSTAFLVSADVINSCLKERDPSQLHLDFFKNISLRKSFELEPISNELRLSINFVAWLGRDLPLIREEFSNGIGSDDEWRLCSVIPKKVERHNLVLKNFRACHFSFGNQSFDKEKMLKEYRLLSTRRAKRA